jgi:hypothetical protein
MPADDDSHAAVPLAIGAVVARLGELEAVFGPSAKETLEAVRASLIAAMAARDRGDAEAATKCIGEGMNRLAGLADQLDPTEAVLMRVLAEQFRAALVRRDTSAAQRTADVMFERSGSRWLDDDKKKG